MAPRKPKPRRKPKPEAQEVDNLWSMYPSLHDSVSQLLEADNLAFTFFPTDSDEESIEDYDTNIMGRFQCPNKACPKVGWAGQQYNARVYHQHCKDCGWLSYPVPADESYAERVAYRLKKWSGIEVDRPYYRTGTNDRPHKRDLCEGCKHGHCKGS